MPSRTVSLGSDWYVLTFSVPTTGISLVTTERVTAFRITNTSDEILYLYRDTTRNKEIPIYPHDSVDLELNRTDHVIGTNQSLGYLRSEATTVSIPVLIVLV